MRFAAVWWVSSVPRSLLVVGPRAIYDGVCEAILGQKIRGPVLGPVFPMSIPQEVDSPPTEMVTAGVRRLWVVVIDNEASPVRITR